VGALGARRLGAVALLLALSVFLSRILGFVREMVLAARIGVGPQTDAYYAAFQIPDLLNYLLAGGALAIAFTPLYLQTLGREGEDAARELFETVLGSLAGVSCLATLGLWIYAEELVDLQFPLFDAETRAQTVWLTRIVLPGQIFFISGGIVRAVLMARGRFAAQAAAPLIYNGAIIAGGLLTGSVEGFAWGALLGAALGNWAFPVYDMRHLGGIGFRCVPWDPRFRVYLWGALPLMLGLSLTTVDEWYERILGARLGVGAVASLAFARRLMMAPVAVIGQAVATAALPTLSSLHAEGRSRELDLRLLSTLRATLLLAIVAGGACYLLSSPIVVLVYRHGAFGAEDAVRVASLLAWMAFAIPGWVTQQIAVRAFFARGEMWRPMALGTAVALLAIPLYIRLGEARGVEGLVLAGVLAISANAILTLVWTRLRFGGPPLAPLASTGLRSLIVAGLAVGLCRLLVANLAPASESAQAAGGSLSEFWRFGLAAGSYGLLVVAGIRWLGDGAMRDTWRALEAKLVARFRKAPQDETA
jgi:putative peptidoglycan lipid II flippase